MTHITLQGYKTIKYYLLLRRLDPANIPPKNPEPNPPLLPSKRLLITAL